MKTAPAIFRIIILLFALLATGACRDQKGSNPAEAGDPGISFAETRHDFGSLAYGSPTKVYFVFRNTGSAPLVLQTVRSSCNCTTPEWPREPLEPGEKDSILVSYNTRIPGYFKKTISVYYNRETRPVRLYVEGSVDEPDNPDSLKP